MSKSKILIASIKDHSFEECLDVLSKEEQYEVLIAHSGEEALEILLNETPELLLLDLMLPSIHSLQVMKELQNKGLSTKTMIFSMKSIEQDYVEALELGACYYMIKPFPKDLILETIEACLNGALKALKYHDALRLSCPEPESIYSSSQEKRDAHKLPKSLSVTAPTQKNYMKFWGTRGSVPVSGYEHLLYGGNTSCLEICHENELIIIDAGTGIRALSKEILHNRNVKGVHLFISHTHWDHILGFPFFLPSYNEDYQIHVYAPKGPRKAIKEIFTGMLAREYFPVALEEMAAKFHFHELDGVSDVTIGDLKIHLTYANHPGPCVCFRIETENDIFGYATDNEMFTGYQGHPKDVDEKHPLYQAYRPLIDFFKPCNILIHEAQYTPLEYTHRIGWGHSSITNASILAKFCKPSKWYVTHHDPEATDENLMNRLLIHKEVLEECGLDIEVHLAYDYLTLPI